MAEKNGWYVIANLPAVQRDLYSARALRRADDPAQVTTQWVAWPDMVVTFATDGAITEASVEVAPDISLVTFTRRLESLLDCSAKSEGVEWVMKFSCRISDYGTVEDVRRLLFDKIASLNGETGETVGVLKIKRRGVEAGHAKIRIVPAENSLQLVCRHQMAQGLKAVWKSVLWRLRPQYGEDETQEKKGKKANGAVQAGSTTSKTKTSTEPCIWVHSESYYWKECAAEVSQLGGEVDIEVAKSKGVNVTLPLAANNLQGFGNWSYSSWSEERYSRYYAGVKVAKLPAGIPEGASLADDGTIQVTDSMYSRFREKALRLSEWLSLGWTLPPVPAETNETKPAR